MSSWTLKSIPPHDWFLCLDVESYFDHEHDPENIFERGFTRPIPLDERDIIVTVFFNGDAEQPAFHVQCNEDLSKTEIEQANKRLAKIFGTEMDLRPLYDKAINDPVLGNELSSFYGLKRMTRANLFEDIQNRIVEMQMNHKPTAKKMMFRIREAYGTTLVQEGKNLPAWPRPFQLMKADPANIRKLGPTLRKGQFLVDMANDIVGGNLDIEYLTQCAPDEFYKTITKVRGIGPTSAQDLMMMRGRTDAIFPSIVQKGEEKGFRRWIIYSYGGDPNHTSDEQFLKLIHNWNGYEGAAIEFLYVDWIMKEKEKRAK